MYDDFKNWYVNYCSAEFSPLDHEDDASDFDCAYNSGSYLGLVYSTFADENGDEHDIEVCITLNPAEEVVYVDGECTFRHRFDSLSDLYNSFKGSDWDGIYNWALMYHTGV